MSEKRFLEAGEIIGNGLELVQEPPYAEVDESEQLRLAAEDLAHFKPLYERWMPPVYRYFFHRIGNIPDAEELTSQVFLAVCEQLPKYHHRGSFAAWLFGIARRRAADFFRRQRRSVQLEAVDPVDPGPDPLAQAASGDEIRRLRGLIRALPEKDQELIRLRFVAGLTYSEMGSLLKRNEDAVRKYLARLLIRLQNRLEGRDE